jgi:AcrR family transcriptional regulator
MGESTTLGSGALLSLRPDFTMDPSTPSQSAPELDSGHAPTPLPRGRHKLSPEVVRASQRERLLDAMLDQVAESGYEATTVAQVVARARVSRNAFYVLFEDKLACFVALCESMCDQLLEETFNVEDVSDWRVATREGARRYLRWWAVRPRFARAWLIEAPLAGYPAAEQRARAFTLFRGRFELLAEGARYQEPDLAPLRVSASHVIVAGITALITHEVGVGRAAELESLTDEVQWLVERLLAEPA